MTFYATLAGTDAHVDLVLALRVEGIPVAFVERAIPAAVATSLSGYTQFVGLTRVEEGEAQLDFEERRETGATLEVELLDDSARTLAALFAINTRRLTWISADAAVGATSLSLETAGLTNGQAIYTDAETITIGTVASATSLTGCTRGAFGSTAAALYGALGDGDSVYTVPPNWRTRRAYLYGYALRADGGGFEQLLGVWTIDEPPRHTGDNLWALTLASVVQEYYGRSVGVGLEPARIISTSYASGTYTHTVDDADKFRTGTLFQTYAVIEDINRSGPTYHTIMEVTGVNTLTNLVDVNDRALFGTTTVTPRPNSMRPIQLVGGYEAMLYILLSREGQGAATAYDRLPGRLPSTTNNQGWRVGAGFVTAEVDVTSWQSVPSRPDTIIIDRERPLSDILKEFCLLNGVATRVTFDGKLSVFTLATPKTTAATTLGPNSVIPDSRVEVLADEGAIYPLASVNWTPIFDEYEVQANLVDVATAKRYPRIQARRELEFRSIACSDAPPIVVQGEYRSPFKHPSTVELGELQTITSDIQRGDGGLARRFVRLSLTMAHLDLRIGDVVTLSGLPDAFSTLPDMAGGTLNGARCRVVSRRPRYDEGRVDVQLMILDPLLVVCPSAVIASAAGATLTLATTGIEVSGTSPANDFYAGVGVIVYDVSAGSFNSRTVASIPATNQITLSSAPSFVVEAGVDYVVLDPVGSSSSGTTASGYTISEFAALASDAGVVSIAPGINTNPRWR
jgi:hypothetical protein